MDTFEEKPFDEFEEIAKEWKEIEKSFREEYDIHSKEYEEEWVKQRTAWEKKHHIKNTWEMIGNDKWVFQTGFEKEN